MGGFSSNKFPEDSTRLKLSNDVKISAIGSQQNILRHDLNPEPSQGHLIVSSLVYLDHFPPNRRRLDIEGRLLVHTNILQYLRVFSVPEYSRIIVLVQVTRPHCSQKGFSFLLALTLDLILSSYFVLLCLHATNAFSESLSVPFSAQP